MIKTGNKNFWIAQASGWGLMAISNFMVQALAGVPLKLLLSNAIVPFVCGFLLTSAYRYLIRGTDWQKWNFRQTILLIFASTLALTLIFMVLVSVVIVFLYAGEGGESGGGIGLAAFFSNFYIFFLIMGLWNLIYFWIHYFNNWNKAEIEKWRLAAEMKDAQLGSLKSQINPHFVFNALNNIRALILEDPERARHMLLNFSDLFRYSLKHTRQQKVELEEEIEIVNQYLELVSIQYEEKLAYEIQVEAGIEQIQIPPMVLQLLVENAVKHGISQQKEGGLVKIEVSQVANFLDIMVANSGKLNGSAKLGGRLGVGLENIRKRLEILYNGTARLEMKEEFPFVIASLKIPV